MASSFRKPKAERKPRGEGTDDPALPKVTPRKERRGKGLEGLGRVSLSAMGPLAKGSTGIAVALLADWAAIVGDDLAARTTPERLSKRRGKDGRTQSILKVRAASGAVATALSHRKPLVLERIATHFGQAAVHDLSIVQGGLAAPPVRKPRPDDLAAEKAQWAAKLGDVQDPNLREALACLGAALDSKS